MLVHKETMGVLHSIWTGEFRKSPTGISEPVNRLVKLSDVDDPEEWVEVPNSSPFAKVILMYYPWITLRFDEFGAVSGVTILDNPIQRTKEEIVTDTSAAESEKRGYRSGKKLRPKKLMPFLRRDKQS